MPTYGFCEKCKKKVRIIDGKDLPTVEPAARKHFDKMTADFKKKKIPYATNLYHGCTQPSQDLLCIKCSICGTIVKWESIGKGLK
ncbi:MAG: hypothetical protein ABII22_00605 [Candidatus Micrarchaeota archaeon]